VKGPRRSSNKEESQQFEDDRSFVSNISTTISEKQKPYEDELRVCREIKDDAIIEKGSIMDLMHNTHFHNPQVLFEVSIQNGRTANSVLVWDVKLFVKAILNYLE